MDGITVKEQGLDEAWKYFDKMKDSLDPKFLKSTIRRNSKPIVDDMKLGALALSAGLSQMVGATTALRRTGKYGVRIGVTKNDPALFPTFSAPALASLFEYGTEERFRTLKKFGFVIGVFSTGRMTRVPFLRPAWVRGVGSMINKTVKAIKKRVP